MQYYQNKLVHTCIMEGNAVDKDKIWMNLIGGAFLAFLAWKLLYPAIQKEQPPVEKIYQKEGFDSSPYLKEHSACITNKINNFADCMIKCSNVKMFFTCQARCEEVDEKMDKQCEETLDRMAWDSLEGLEEKERLETFHMLKSARKED